jgi:phage-related protein
MDEVEVTELFFDFIKTLPISTQKSITDGSDVLNELTYDSEEDLKNEIWNRVKYSVNFTELIYLLKDYLKNTGNDTDSDTDNTNTNTDTEEE